MFALKEKQLMIFLLVSIGVVLSSIFAVVGCKRGELILEHIQI